MDSGSRRSRSLSVTRKSCAAWCPCRRFIQYVTATGWPGWSQEAGLGFADMRLAVESLAQFRPRTAARRLARVERLVFEDLGENLTHQDHVIVRRNKGGSAARP